MAEVKFTVQSISDLEDSAEYTSKDSFFYASMQVQKLIKRTEALEKQPLSGRIVPELRIKSHPGINRRKLSYRLSNCKSRLDSHTNIPPFKKKAESVGDQKNNQEK